MIIFMWAQSKNFVIGKNNDMPWSNKEEMSFFAKTTRDENIAMGRVTYDAIRKPLKFKKSINIISRSEVVGEFGELYFKDIKKLVDFYNNKGEDLYIIGGYQVFQLAKKYVDQLYISVLNDEYDGDLYMDKFNVGSSEISLFENEFKLIKLEKYDSFVFYKYGK